MVEHRKELREKVEHQQKLLEKELLNSEAEHHPAERIAGLSTELSVVKDALTGGWETMSGATAARLTQWLESTRSLISGEKQTGIQKPVPPPPVDEQVHEVAAGSDKTT